MCMQHDGFTWYEIDRALNTDSNLLFLRVQAPVQRLNKRPHLTSLRRRGTQFALNVGSCDDDASLRVTFR